jgi:hypothetical protein
MGFKEQGAGQLGVAENPPESAKNEGKLVRLRGYAQGKNCRDGSFVWGI